MIEPSTPEDEEVRLAGLYALDILDTPAEERFDRLTRMAALAFDVPMCLVSLVDGDRQWFKSGTGLDASETPRNISFCGHAILEAQPLVVPDSHLDPRFADNPLVVAEPNVRFYAGQPLEDAAGNRLGTLCILDTRPRSMDAAGLELLAEFGRLVELELVSGGVERALAQAEASDELHRSVVAGLEEGVLVVGGDGVIASVNESAVDMLGLPVEQIVGRNLADLGTIPEFQWVGPDRKPLPDEERPLIRSLVHGETVSGQIVGLRSSPDDLMWISVNCRPLAADAGGNVGRVVLSFIDVTHRLEVDRMKNEFVSVVSHELRTPLTSIRGALGLLASGHMGSVDASAARMLAIAVSNTDRLIRLINDILDVERIQSGRLTLDCAEVDVTALIGQVMEVMEPIADEAGVELVVHSRQIHAWVDADRIIQALTNLVNNAVKFSDRGSCVEVTVDQEGDEVAIHVTDRGRGIPEERQASVFERFRQVDASDSREKGGTGLGLSISKDIVEQHGGRIGLRSHPGLGSTFSIFLPALAEGRLEPATMDAEPGKPHVLLVEDDGDLASVVVEVFRATGTTIDHAPTAHDALVAASAHVPDLIVLDVLLPDASGFELVDALRRHDVLRATPLVVYTALELSPSERQRLRLGPTHFLTKSIVTPRAFIDKVLSVLAPTSPTPSN